MSEASKPAWTQGPWEKAPFITTNGRPSTVPNLAAVYMGEGNEAEFQGSDAHANCALWLAARDLYDALVLADELYEVGVFDARDGLWEQVHARRRAALAKARGES